jgi:hypothetical protein
MLLLIFSLTFFFCQLRHVGYARQAVSSAKVSPVLIVAPQEGCQVKAGEKVNVMVNVKPGLKVVSVAVLTDDGKGIGMATAAPYIVSCDTTGLLPGTYRIRAQAHLEDGRVIESLPVGIVVEGEVKPAAPAGAVVKEGTPVILTTEETMVSGKIAEGSVVRFHVDNDVIGPDGQILIPCKAMAYGKVLASRPHGMFGRPGKLDFTVESATAADGTSVSLRAVRNATASDAGALVIVGALLLSVLFVFFCGNNVEIPAGTTFSAYVNHDTVIARPAPSRLAAADLAMARSVTVTDPVEGGRLKKGKKVTCSCSLSPADDGAYIRLYLDGDLVAWQKGNPSSVAWQGAKTGKVKQGNHELYAEVTFSSGHIVKSPSVRFELTGE